MKIEEHYNSLKEHYGLRLIGKEIGLFNGQLAETYKLQHPKTTSSVSVFMRNNNHVLDLLTAPFKGVIYEVIDDDEGCDDSSTTLLLRQKDRQKTLQTKVDSSPKEIWCTLHRKFVKVILVYAKTLNDVELYNPSVFEDAVSTHRRVGSHDNVKAYKGSLKSPFQAARDSGGKESFLRQALDRRALREMPYSVAYSLRKQRDLIDAAVRNLHELRPQLATSLPLDDTTTLKRITDFNLILSEYLEAQRGE